MPLSPFVRPAAWLNLALWGTLAGIALRTAPAQGQLLTYCRFSPTEIAQKNQLRNGAIRGDSKAQKLYGDILKRHASSLQQCRQQNWPQEQGIWLRLYNCDSRPGSLDALLDDIVSKGYNRVNLEVFYNSQVLLPKNNNPTPWQSVVEAPGQDNRDLLAEAIQKAHARGLKIYAWLYTLNFGYEYSLRPQNDWILARNGYGQTSLEVVQDHPQAFIDPYNPQAQQQYYTLVKAILARKPDGILFDYVRYPRGSGNQSVAGNVRDLFIYSDASLQALYRRAQNNQGLFLIKRYVEKGSITAQDVAEAKTLFPGEVAPQWQGRSTWMPTANGGTPLTQIQGDLWYLTVAHAAQGVLDFLNLMSLPAQRQGITAGAVFFPGGNQVVGQSGFDSRLQPWDNFASNLEWNPMSYSVCNDASCIVNEVQRVLGRASTQTKVTPALAGVWNRSMENRPSLEDQMAAIARSTPRITSVSHFAYSWQEPDSDRQRKFCQF